MMLRAIIIEDEEPARILLKKYLESFDNIELITECSDGFAGVKAINELKPDIVFLDVQMPKLTGFEVLEIIDFQPVIIFTTAYDQYAIKAFEANAVDYLLKPFSKQRFEQSIQKAIEIIKSKQNLPIKQLIESNDDKVESLNRIAIKNGGEINLISVDDIIYLESNGDYVNIYTKNGRFLKEKTMKYFENHLDASKFIRIHRSYIVNANEIRKIEHYGKETYVAILKNNVSLSISVSGYRKIKEIIEI